MATVLKQSGGLSVDEEFIRRALDQAQINALRIALFQQTRDPELEEMAAVRTELRGTPYEFPKISKEHAAVIKQKAFEYLRDRDPASPSVMPSREEAAHMMEMFNGKKISEQHVDYGWGDLAFADNGFVRAARWKNKPADEELDKFHVTIIGAGFSGLMAAIQMQQLGLKFTIIERQAGLGGTWYLNDYPEARVDITSFIYQYKFEQDYPWKSHFATQGDLRDYVDYIVDKHGLREHIRLNTKVTGSVWNEENSRWDITTEDGDGNKDTLNSQFMISGAGLFSTPKLPQIEGIEKFRGKMFHTTAWDHDYDYTGKRVAVIGTGSTGSQLVRGVAAKASQLTIYQRTPNWVNQVPGYRNEVTPELRWLLDNMPGYKNWFSYHHTASAMQVEAFQYLDDEWIEKGGVVSEKNEQLRQMLQGYIRSKVGDNDELYEQLVPDYAPMSRRLVVDNDWYDSLLLDNVDLVSGPIDHFTENGIVSPDGTEREFDLVVLSAGFDVERYLWPVEYEGRDGTTLEDLWSEDGARAHLTLTIPKFPNFIILYGPNAGAVTGSFHSWMECLTRYSCRLITETIESGSKTFEIKEDVYLDYNDRLDKGLKTLLLENQGAGGGYYLNSHGRPGVTQPWTFDQFYEMIREPDFDEYSIR
ncbi:4-hydroxyacetophenone monooxygenase [Parasphingorhabdus marina DSM 22363]|uniref:4-hydroxyacetophenone monooxygenase n=1 Tax=Parasphingorhabdus marina DSM 22363 TaxID=1123272 RepID=A0A1N6D1E3_9SPHN|nr:NAD(P)/FAD-dependent oxidoreductase [Parasphingorhabdus marina]SIN64517.1 4-hydroxyacetophenone monooxygenase [Parasphingorhabdus marina DSM 22363]